MASYENTQLAARRPDLRAVGLGARSGASGFLNPMSSHEEVPPDRIDGRRAGSRDPPLRRVQGWQAWSDDLARTTRANRVAPAVRTAGQWENYSQRVRAVVLPAMIAILLGIAVCLTTIPERVCEAVCAAVMGVIMTLIMIGRGVRPDDTSLVLPAGPSGWARPRRVARLIIVDQRRYARPGWLGLALEAGGHMPTVTPRRPTRVLIPRWADGYCWLDGVSPRLGALAVTALGAFPRLDRLFELFPESRRKLRLTRVARGLVHAEASSTPGGGFPPTWRVGARGAGASPEEDEGLRTELETGVLECPYCGSFLVVGESGPSAGITPGDCADCGYHFVVGDHKFAHDAILHSKGRHWTAVRAAGALPGPHGVVRLGQVSASRPTPYTAESPPMRWRDRVGVDWESQQPEYEMDSMYRENLRERGLRNPRNPTLHHVDPVVFDAFSSQPAPGPTHGTWLRLYEWTCEALRLPAGGRAIVVTAGNTADNSLTRNPPSDVIPDATRGIVYALGYTGGPIHPGWTVIYCPLEADQGRLLAGARLLPAMVPGVTTFFFICNERNSNVSYRLASWVMDKAWPNTSLVDGALPTNLGATILAGGFLAPERRKLLAGLSLYGDVYGSDEIVLAVRRPVAIVHGTVHPLAAIRRDMAWPPSGWVIASELRDPVWFDRPTREILTAFLMRREYPESLNHPQTSEGRLVAASPG